RVRARDRIAVPRRAAGAAAEGAIRAEAGRRAAARRRSSRRRAVIGRSMRFRLAVAGVLAAGLAAPAAASALNPQDAGLRVGPRAQGLYDGPIDAIVGPRTVAAIRTFQRTHGPAGTRPPDVRLRRALGPFGP